MENLTNIQTYKHRIPRIPRDPIGSNNSSNTGVCQTIMTVTVGRLGDKLERVFFVMEENNCRVLLFVSKNRPDMDLVVLPQGAVFHDYGGGSHPEKK